MTSETLRKLLKQEKQQAVRTRTIGVRVSEEELGRLNDVAAREGLPPATLARVLILAGVADLEREPWDEEG